MSGEYPRNRNIRGRNLGGRLGSISCRWDLPADRYRRVGWVTQTFASWNPIGEWLRCVEGLRQAVWAHAFLWHGQTRNSDCMIHRREVR